MSLKRAEMRRRQRENDRIQKSIRNVVRRFPESDADEIASRINIRLNDLENWANSNIEAIWKDASDQMNEILKKAEDYICAVHIVASLRAMELSCGDLKTVTQRMNKFLDCWNDSISFVNTLGTREALKDIESRHELNEIEFDDFDINQLWEHEDRVAKAKETMAEKIRNEQKAEKTGAGSMEVMCSRVGIRSTGS